MQDHTVVPRDEWLSARRELLVKEKEFTRLRDELTAQRQALPWEKIDKHYVFDGPGGRMSLSDLFEGRSQLIISHFMFGPDWAEGCPSCSFWADSYDGVPVHLNERDISFAVVSRARLETLSAYKERMGWGFKWVSSFSTDFNYDAHVSFTPEEMQRGEMFYNYHDGKFPSDEAPGMSVFYRNTEGEIFHTYSCFARGLDILNGAYNLMDLTPKGRDEADLPYTMAWLKRHDQYGD